MAGSALRSSIRIAMVAAPLSLGRPPPAGASCRPSFPARPSSATRRGSRPDLARRPAPGLDRPRREGRAPGLGQDRRRGRRPDRHRRHKQGHPPSTSGPRTARSCSTSRTADGDENWHVYRGGPRLGHGPRLHAQGGRAGPDHGHRPGRPRPGARPLNSATRNCTTSTASTSTRRAHPRHREPRRRRGFAADPGFPGPRPRRCDTPEGGTEIRESGRRPGRTGGPGSRSAPTRSSASSASRPTASRPTSSRRSAATRPGSWGDRSPRARSA